jgi:hypothetical protein
MREVVSREDYFLTKYQSKIKVDEMQYSAS